MSKIIHQPHDKLFKQAMADIRVAKEFFATHLSKELLQRIDLASLKLQKNSFIDDSYKASAADVVYSVNLNGALAYFYLLCEHQTEIDPMMAFRLLSYRIKIIEQYVKQYPKTPLPIVYALVVYTGKKLWDAPLDVFELFAEQQALAKELLLAPYQLVDVQRLNDEELQYHTWSGLVEFVFKYRELRDFKKFLEILLPWLDGIVEQEGLTYAQNVLRYITDGLDNTNKELFIEKVNYYLTTQLREDAMTLAQQFRQEGLQEGIEKVAKSLLHKGYSAAEVADITDLSLNYVEQLKANIDNN